MAFSENIQNLLMKLDDSKDKHVNNALGMGDGNHGDK